ncbi:MAG: hypothetical protein U0Z70_13825 [Thermomicrobiales bacterium]
MSGSAGQVLTNTIRAGKTAQVGGGVLRAGHKRKAWSACSGVTATLSSRAGPLRCAFETSGALTDSAPSTASVHALLRRLETFPEFARAAARCALPGALLLFLLPGVDLRASKDWRDEEPAKQRGDSTAGTQCTKRLRKPIELGIFHWGSLLHTIEPAIRLAPDDAIHIKRK